MKTTTFLLSLFAGMLAMPGACPGDPDITPPTSTIAYPADGTFVRGTSCVVTGAAVDDTGGTGVKKVEVSTDGGVNWAPAAGTGSWSYNWTLPDPASAALWRVASAWIRNMEGSDTRTVRVRHVLCADGSQVRVGFVSGPTQPLSIEEAYIGNDAGNGSVSGNVRLTFGGNGSVTVPAGSIVYADPMVWPAVRGGTVVVTSYGSGTSVGRSYDFPAYYEDGNVSSVTRALANTGVFASYTYDIYNALVVGVLQEGVNANEDVLLIGDSITSGLGSVKGSAGSWAQRLAARVNVFNSARSGTTALYESSVLPMLLGRGIAYGKAVVSLGTNDIIGGASADDVKTYLGSIFTTLKNAGIKVIAGNIIPRSFTGTQETSRLDINNWLNTLPNGIWAVVDFDSAVRDQSDPSKLAAAFNCGDNVHPSDLGHAAMFGAVERENLFTAGMLLEVTARATDNSDNVESPGPVARVFLDNDRPVSDITDPPDQAGLSGVTYSVKGTAFDGSGSGIDGVEVSTDGGATWSVASGTTAWSYDWLMPVRGNFSLKSRARDAAGNQETPGDGLGVTVAAYGTQELEHYDWQVFLSGGDCGACHVSPGIFVPQDARQHAAGFCISCHNQASMAHERAVPSGRGHSIMRSITSAGARPPTYGNVTAGEYSNQPHARLMDGSKVVCATCHNIMRKTEDFGRTWEPTTTSDYLTYSLQRGGWACYGYLAPKVYRDTGLNPAPQYSKSRKDYLVDPSEYDYNDALGTITFKTARQSSDYIFVTLDYPYLRASSQDNRLCSDCHVQATHKGVNCLVCHQAHGTDNIAGIRGMVRTADMSVKEVVFRRYTGANSFADGGAAYDGICEVCHTLTRYYRRDGSGFTNHSGGLCYDRKDCTLCHTHASGFAR